MSYKLTVKSEDHPSLNVELDFRYKLKAMLYLQVTVIGDELMDQHFNSIARGLRTKIEIPGMGTIEVQAV